MTLFAYKWLYPNRVFLNRGNHETKDMNKVYGFEGEVKHKHGEMTYKVRTLISLWSFVLTTILGHSCSQTSSPTVSAPDRIICVI